MHHGNKNADEVEAVHVKSEIESHAGLESGPENEHNDADEDVDSWPSYDERIDSMVPKKKCSKPIQFLEDRRQNMAHQVRMMQRDAPKTFIERSFKKVCQVDRQLAVSSTRLGELVKFGNELATNIRVANERRELDRRIFEASQQRDMKRNLEGEKMEAMAKFEDIRGRWTELTDINEPMALWDQMEEQKKRMGEIMERKDEMINACQMEIDRMNAKYESDRKRQAADLCCLVERIDNQVEILKDAYRKHLELLRNTVEDEGQAFSLTAAERWRSFFNALNANFEQKSKVLRVREVFYVEQTQKIQDAQDEITKQTRVRLEKECSRLELELRRTRDNVLMNSEKLDYNYQVLQRRNEENTIITNQQKRRVARLHETVARTRRHYKEIRKSTRHLIRKLTNEIQTLHDSISDMELKALHTRRINQEKFNRVWNINYDEITTLLKRIYNIDRILHEQQLVMPWKYPDIDVENINKPMDEDITNNAMRAIERRFGVLPKKYGGSGCAPKRSKHKPQETSVELPLGSKRLLRNLFRKLADRGSFLIEEKLLKILRPFCEKEQVLVRVDNIFAALRIRNLGNLLELAQVFEPYTYCPNCEPHGLSPLKCAEIFLKDEPFANSLQIDVNRDKKILHGTWDRDTFLVQGHGKRPEVCKNHFMVMEPALVLHAMNIFTRRKHKELYGNGLGSRLDGRLIHFEDEEIVEFWRKFTNLFPDAKSHLWKTLEHGLNHYVEVLKMRVQYDAEVVFLRRQNRELRHLLQKFKV